LDTSLCRISMMPDRDGVVEVPVSGGGPCPGGTVRVLAGGTLLAVRGEPACFDQNGDLRVDSTDSDMVVSRLGTNNAAADFDGDRAVTQADLAILSHHLGHTSSETDVPARKSTPSSTSPRGD
jgi:hypothetical protein